MHPIKESEILFIVNPNSGRGAYKKIVPILEEYDVGIEISRDLQALTKILQRDLSRYRACVAVGGDGTVHHLIDGIKDADVVVGVLPTGSGNGFARELGFVRNVRTLINKLQDGKWIDIDLLYVNGKVCANVFGLGFDGQVAHVFQGISGRGFWSYVFAVWRAFRHFSPFEATVRSEKEYSGVYTMIVAANTRQYGNHAIIAAKALPDDGKYDLLLIKKIPTILVPVFILKMFTGRLGRSRYVEYIQTAQKTVIRSGFRYCHIDGEPAQCGDNIEIAIFRKRVRVADMRAG
jgi:diacylglycerol kinase family enzyme